MTICDPCIQAGVFAKENPEATWEDIHNRHCREAKRIDTITGVETLPTCTCQHREAEQLLDGTVAPKGVRKDVRG